MAGAISHDREGCQFVLYLTKNLPLHRPPRPASTWYTRVGWYQPYATSHDDLDKDTDLQEEVRHSALTLCEAVRQIRSGRYHRPDEGLEDPRKK